MKLSIAVDLHGTITRYPDKFKSLMLGWMANGDTITVMSGPPIEEVESELLSLGFGKGIRCF